MRIRNLLGMGMLLGLAACEGETKEDTGTDTVTDDDTETETTDTYTYTTETGPWEINYFAYTATFGVGADGSIVPVTDVDGNELTPLFIVDFVSEDYFYGSSDEACELILDMSGATLTAATGSNYAAWSFDATTAAILSDNCDAVSTFPALEGLTASDVWGAQIYTVQIGMYDSAFWDNYIPATYGYADELIGGIITDQIFAYEDGSPYPYSLLGQAFGTDASGSYDYNAPLLPSEVQSATGVTPGFYFVQTIFSGI